jgi:hypothetical protein
MGHLTEKKAMSQPYPPLVETAVDAVLNSLRTQQDLWLVDPPTPSSPGAEQTQFWASNNENFCRYTLSFGQHNLRLLPPELANWREVIRRMGPVAVTYFFGAWRDAFLRFGYDPHDRARARQELPWTDVWRAGMALSAVASDWESLDRLTHWSGLELEHDEGSFDRTREDCAYLNWLGMTLRGDGPVAEPLRTGIAGSSRRRAKMNVAMAEAVLGGDAANFAAQTTTYLRYYLKNELRPKQVELLHSPEATMLWHLARRRGMGEVALPDDVAFLIGRV